MHPESFLCLNLFLLTKLVFFSKHLNKERTSTNAWCVEDCYDNNTTQAVIHRLENITGIPDTNSEYLQLLRVCCRLEITYFFEACIFYTATLHFCLLA